MGDVSPPPDPISSAQSANERHGPSRSPLGLGTTITTTATTITKLSALHLMWMQEAS